MESQDREIILHGLEDRPQIPICFEYDSMAGQVCIGSGMLAGCHTLRELPRKKDEELKKKPRRRRRG